jgi:hypothetical protein
MVSLECATGEKTRTLVMQRALWNYKNFRSLVRDFERLLVLALLVPANISRTLAGNRPGRRVFFEMTDCAFEVFE